MRRFLSLAGTALVLLAVSPANADHNPPRPQVSYECDRFALKFYPAKDRWECVAGSKKKLTKDTEKRLRQLKRDVDARIRALQEPSVELKNEQVQRLQQLINQQRKLVKTLQNAQ